MPVWNDLLCFAGVITKKRCFKYINENKWTRNKFIWQDGFGVFSYGKSQIKRVYNYIQNQEKHHKKYSFKEEYINFLKKYEIDYNPKYVADIDWFEWIYLTTNAVVLFFCYILSTSTETLSQFQRLRLFGKFFYKSNCHAIIGWTGKGKHWTVNAVPHTVILSELPLQTFNH